MLLISVNSHDLWGLLEVTDWSLIPLFFLSLLFSGFAVGIYTTNSPEACQYVAENCKANIIVVENHKQLQKILQVRPGCIQCIFKLKQDAALSGYSALSGYTR